MIKTFWGKNSYIKDKMVRLNCIDCEAINLNILESPDLNELAIINLNPVFGRRRIVIVNSLLNLSDNTETIKFIKEKRKTTYLIFNLTDFSKKTKLQTWLRNNSGYKQVKLYKFKDCESYLNELISESGVRFNVDSKHYFLFLTGNKPEIIDIEFYNILSNITKTTIIENSVIAKYVTRRTKIDVFKIIDDLFIKDVRNVVDTVRLFCDNKASVSQFINLLVWKLGVAVMIKEGDNVNTTDLNPYSISTTNKLIRDYNLNDLVLFYVSVCELNYRIREGLLNPLPDFLSIYLQFRGVTNEKNL